MVLKLTLRTTKGSRTSLVRFSNLTLGFSCREQIWANIFGGQIVDFAS